MATLLWFSLFSLSFSRFPSLSRWALRCCYASFSFVPSLNKGPASSRKFDEQQNASERVKERNRRWLYKRATANCIGTFTTSLTLFDIQSLSRSNHVSFLSPSRSLIITVHRHRRRHDAGSKTASLVNQGKCSECSFFVSLLFTLSVAFVRFIDRLSAGERSMFGLLFLFFFAFARIDKTRFDDWFIDWRPIRLFIWRENLAFLFCSSSQTFLIAKIILRIKKPTRWVRSKRSFHIFHPYFSLFLLRLNELRREHLSARCASMNRRSSLVFSFSLALRNFRPSDGAAAAERFRVSFITNELRKLIDGVPRHPLV